MYKNYILDFKNVTEYIKLTFIKNRFLLIDCDEFTRKYCDQFFKISQPDPIKIEKKKLTRPSQVKYFLFIGFYFLLAINFSFYTFCCSCIYFHELLSFLQ